MAATLHLVGIRPGIFTCAVPAPSIELRIVNINVPNGKSQF